MKTPAGKRARSEAVKRRHAFLLFPSLICQSLAGKPAPQGSPLFPKVVEVPKTARQGRRRPDRPRLEPVRRHAGVSGTSRPFWSQSEAALLTPTAGERLQWCVKPRRAVNGSWSATSEQSGVAPRAGDLHSVLGCLGESSSRYVFGSFSSLVLRKLLMCLT